MTLDRVALKAVNAPQMSFDIRVFLHGCRLGAKLVEEVLCCLFITFFMYPRLRWHVDGEFLYRRMRVIGEGPAVFFGQVPT